MQKYNFKMLTALLFAFSSLIGTISCEAIPVMIWDTKQIALSTLPSLEIINQPTFSHVIEQHVRGGIPLLAFVEENLSLEDFTLLDVYGHAPLARISSLGKKTGNEVHFLPFVEDPVDVLKELPKTKLKQLSLDEVLREPKAALDKHGIVIVTLNDAREEENRFEMLQRHGDSIANIFKQLKVSGSSFVSLFTANKNSWRSGAHIRSNRIIRDTSKADNSSGILLNTENAILYLLTSPVVYNNTETVVLDDYTLTTANKTNNSLLLKLHKDGSGISLSFLIVFDVFGYWTLRNLTINVDNNSVNLDVPDVYASVNNFSYHCGNSVFYANKNRNLYLQLPGFQFQPSLSAFTILAFGDSYDCVNFMTIPILSGLFVSFILALIMTFALITIMDIKTMDRFDDPKGKTITISATE